MGTSVISHVRSDGTAYTTTFSGWAAQSCADKYFNELKTNPHTLYAVHRELAEEEEGSYHETRSQFIRDAESV